MDQQTSVRDLHLCFVAMSKARGHLLQSTQIMKTENTNQWAFKQRQ